MTLAWWVQYQTITFKPNLLRKQCVSPFLGPCVLKLTTLWHSQQLGISPHSSVLPSIITFVKLDFFRLSNNVRRDNIIDNWSNQKEHEAGKGAPPGDLITLVAVPGNCKRRNNHYPGNLCGKLAETIDIHCYSLVNIIESTIIYIIEGRIVKISLDNFFCELFTERNIQVLLTVGHDSNNDTIDSCKGL